MGREAQPPYPRLTPRLEADLNRINFYRFCQLLEKRNPERPLMGSTSHPGDDPVRFAPHPGMGFPASELKAVEYDEDDDSKPPRVNGLNEGLTILNALLIHQWAQLWPQSVHARVEILNGLFQRLQKLFRTFTLGHGDLPALMQTEGLLQGMNDILTRQELKHACQTGPLMQQINSVLTRLENSSTPDSTQPAVTLPPQALAAVPAEAEALPVSRLVYVNRPEPEVSVQVVRETPPPPKRWPVFLAGAGSALVVCAIALAGWHYAHRVDESAGALVASIASLPQALNSKQIQAIQQDKVRPDLAAWLCCRLTGRITMVTGCWHKQRRCGLRSQKWLSCS